MNKLALWVVTKLPHYWKTVMATLPVIAMVGQEVAQAVAEGGKDGTLTWDDVFKIIAAGVGAYLVYRKGNAPKPAS